jgi:hypothetical protein
MQPGRRAGDPVALVSLGLFPIVARSIKENFLQALVDSVVSESFGSVGLSFKRFLAHADTMRGIPMGSRRGTQVVTGRYGCRECAPRSLFESRVTSDRRRQATAGRKERGRLLEHLWHHHNQFHLALEYS